MFTSLSGGLAAGELTRNTFDFFHDGLTFSGVTRSPLPLFLLGVLAVLEVPVFLKWYSWPRFRILRPQGLHTRSENTLYFGSLVLTPILQWNPDFSNPRFHEPPDISNQTLFPLDLLHSSSIISPPISRALDFSKLPITRSNFGSRGTN